MIEITPALVLSLFRGDPRHGLKPRDTYDIARMFDVPESVAAALLREGRDEEGWRKINGIVIPQPEARP